MSFFFNTYVSIVGIHSGIIRRTCYTHGYGHREAPMEVSYAYMDEIGQQTFRPGICDDISVRQSPYQYEPCIVCQRRKPENYSRITLDLYTVEPNCDLSDRSDAVLVRREDIDRITVLSGGGRNGADKREYDNIYIRALVGATILVQPHRSAKLYVGSTIYQVTKRGVNVIRVGFDDLSPIAGTSRNIAKDWVAL